MHLPIDALLRVLAASVAPVIVISGVGLLLLTMTNRYARVIDRARALARESAARDAGTAARRLSEQLAITLRRTRLLRASITLGALCILLVALTVLVLFAEQLAGAQRDTAAVWCFGLGLASLIASMVVFLRDLALSLEALRLEVAPARPGE